MKSITFPVNLFLPKKKRATLLTELIDGRLKIVQPTQFREQINMFDRTSLEQINPTLPAVVDPRALPRARHSQSHVWWYRKMPVDNVTNEFNGLTSRDGPNLETANLLVF